MAIALLDRTRSLSIASWTARTMLYRFFKLNQKEAEFATRGFSSSSAFAQEHLESIGKEFIDGFNCGLAHHEVPKLRKFIECRIPDYRGFFAEGAAMGVTVADVARPWRPILPFFLEVCRDDLDYLTHVGVGWALARVPWRRRAILAALDPVHLWLAYDGLGFHDAYFAPKRVLSGWKRETRGYGAHAYDQGVGRALWFVSGADVPRISRAISELDCDRSADLWSGVGLAMTYAGGGSLGTAAQARAAAGSAAPMLGQGVAFAAEARARGRHIPSHTEETVLTVTSLSLEQAVSLVRAMRLDAELAPEDGTPRYEHWRTLVQRALGAGS